MAAAIGAYAGWISCGAVPGAGPLGCRDLYPQNQIAAPAATRTTAAPTAIPAIAPPPRPWLDELAIGVAVTVVAAVGVGVADVELVVATPEGIEPSLGQSSPGRSMNELDSASCL